MTVLLIEKILHNFQDLKITKFFNLEQVNFRVTLGYLFCTKFTFLSVVLIFLDVLPRLAFLHLLLDKDIKVAK